MAQFDKNILEVVVRYDVLRGLYNAILSMDDVAKVYPKYKPELEQIGKDMWDILLKIAADESGSIEDLRAALKAMDIRGEPPE